jgi:RNase adaptor protein for sRNA GlmZ degradation
MKRFNESRRKHPLSDERIGLKEAIDKESELLEPISVMANLLIDTSRMPLNQLRDSIKDRLVKIKRQGWHFFINRLVTKMVCRWMQILFMTSTAYPTLIGTTLYGP